MNETVLIPYGDDVITLEREDDKWVLKNPEVTKVANNYNRKDLIKYLEENFDEWSTDEDWWGGTETWDVNVFTDGYPVWSEYEDDGLKFIINVYGLEVYDGTLQINTSDELEYMEVTL